MRFKSKAIFVIMKEIPSNYEGYIYCEKGLRLVVTDILLTAIIVDGVISPPHFGSLLQSAYVESSRKDHPTITMQQNFLPHEMEW